MTTSDLAVRITCDLFLDRVPETHTRIRDGEAKLPSDAAVAAIFPGEWHFDLWRADSVRTPVLRSRHELRQSGRSVGRGWNCGRSTDIFAPTVW